MKKILYWVFMVTVTFVMSGCQDFLETTSSSVVDRDFVFSNEESARAALYNGYQSLKDNSELHENGLFWLPIWGSDIEDTVDKFDMGNPEILQKCFFPGGTESFNIDGGGSKGVFSGLYKTIAIANSLIESLEGLDNFSEIMSGDPNGLSDVYGQAVALRATCYWELTRWYGDVPHALRAGEAPEGLTSRYAILDYHTQKLIEVEPHMYRVGENGNRADVMTRSYVQGLIGRICLYNGGYATRRTDLGTDFHTDGEGNVLTFEDWSVEKNNAIYGRRSDWKEVFAIGKKYLQELAANSGSAVLHVTDPRSNESGREYGNPYQYYFAQINTGDWATLGDESLYEITYGPEKNGSCRPGWIGRPSLSGTAPNIGCGQDRLQAHFYYGWFDNDDMRRDAAIVVTGSNGKGQESILSFDRELTNWGGGPSNNKWDWNRISIPNPAPISSSINFSYMRISDAYLMLAEIAAALGDEGTARTYLGLVHHRAFPGNNDPHFDKFITEAGGLYKAVIKERALEFSGEGVRRFDIIRTGILPEVAVETRRVMKTLIDDLKVKGYHEFANGNQIPNYIWIKMVDARSKYGHRLTAQTPSDKKDDPVLFPGWRGQYDDWGSIAPEHKDVTETNVAIKGLFKYIVPGSTEALALEADGYKQTPWGVDMIRHEDSYATNLFAGYTDADYAAKNPPFHIFPVTAQTLVTSGITNGYGFRQK